MGGWCRKCALYQPTAAGGYSHCSGSVARKKTLGHCAKAPHQTASPTAAAHEKRRPMGCLLPQRQLLPGRVRTTPLSSHSGPKESVNKKENKRLKSPLWAVCMAEQPVLVLEKSNLVFPTQASEFFSAHKNITADQDKPSTTSRLTERETRVWRWAKP